MIIQNQAYKALQHRAPIVSLNLLYSTRQLALHQDCDNSFLPNLFQQNGRVVSESPIVDKFVQIRFGSTFQCRTLHQLKSDNQHLLCMRTCPYDMFLINQLLEFWLNIWIFYQAHNTPHHITPIFYLDLWCNTRLLVLHRDCDSSFHTNLPRQIACAASGSPTVDKFFLISFDFSFQCRTLHQLKSDNPHFWCMRKGFYSNFLKNAFKQGFSAISSSATKFRVGVIGRSCILFDICSSNGGF